MPGVADRHSGTLLGAGTVVVAVGGIFMGVTAAEPTKTPRPVWANDWFDVGFSCVILGLLIVAVGVYLHFRKDAPEPPAREAALPQRTEPATVDPADWIAACDEPGDHLVFVLRHRLDNPGDIRAFGAFRCTVIDPGGVTTTATGRALFCQYPRAFPDAPSMRSGTYQFVWEGQDAKGAWREITRGTHEIKLPSLIVTIVEDQFENWKYIALIAALRVRITNTTGAMIRIRAIGFIRDIRDAEGNPAWDTTVGSDERLELERELHARRERQHYGIPLRNYATVPAHESISGWVVEEVTRNPAGGSPRCTVVIEDELRDKYQATLDKREPRTYG